MVSSALYRYFPSRDDLITALIIEAYDVLGAAAEAADSSSAEGDGPRGRWQSVCTAVRGWALDHPHEYALIYGSATPAARVPLVLVGILRDTWHAGEFEPALEGPAPSGTLLEQTRRLAAEIAPELPPSILARTLVAWTQLFGMLSFELFGQLVGSVDPSDEFFAHATEQMAEFVGLRRQ